MARGVRGGEVYGVNSSRAWSHALAIIAGTTALRLVLGAVIPLFPDETYYWEWSRTLAAGYFDHPPMVALFVRAGTALLGTTPLGVRLFPILAGGATALAIALTARRIEGDEAGRLAALVFTCVPIAAVGSVLATPDAPMLCFVAWTLYAVIRALDTGPDAPDGARSAAHTLRWWALAGLCIGLAMASKFTSVFVPAGIALACLLHPRLQNRFGEAGPYVAVAIASCVLAPVLVWNGMHDWVSFKFQLGHGLGAPKGGALGALNRELELIGGQIGLVSPILFYFVVRGIRRAFDPTPSGLRVVLGTVAVTCIAFFLYSATRRSVEANWPAIAWIPAMILVATEPPDSWRGVRWLRGGLALGALLSIVIYVHVLTPILPLPADRDQVAKAFGWDQVGQAVDRTRAFYLQKASFGVSDLFIGAERYQDASELSYHLKDHPRVFSLNLQGRPNQYDLWKTFPDSAHIGASLLLVLDEEVGEPRIIRKLMCCFVRSDMKESVALLRGGALVARKRLWFLGQWNGDWPPRAQPFPWTD